MENFSKVFALTTHTLTKSLIRRMCDSRCDKPSVVYDHSPDFQDLGINALEPCHGEKLLGEPRVVIVGAGLAGLSAGARLAEKGITNFVILEANARPGGRIKSCWLGDVVTELGSTGFLEPYCTHPVYKMAAAEYPPRPGAPAALHTRGLFNSVVPKKSSYPAIVNAYYKFRQIEKEANSIYCTGGSKQHGSLINFMSIRIQQELHNIPEDHQYDAARIMFGLSHMLNSRSGTDMGLLCADQLACYMNMPGGDVRVPLGLISIVAPIMRKIPYQNVRYCKPVKTIYWGTCPESEYHAEVVCCDGERFPCDYVITTVSLGVLNCAACVMFCPSLPSSKIDAMRCLGFGYCNKIFLEYCKPFWYWQRTDLNFKFNLSESCGRPDWTRGITAIETVPNSKHVLCVWVTGQEAMLMEALCDRDVAEAVTNLLRKCTGDNIPYPSSLIRSRWVSDAFFKGSYSFGCCGDDATAFKILGTPVPGCNEPVPPILLFAGEATVPGHNATLVGARLSGIREAERIVKLTLQMQGLPISENLRKKREMSEKAEERKAAVA